MISQDEYISFERPAPGGDEVPGCQDTQAPFLANRRGHSHKGPIAGPIKGILLLCCGRSGDDAPLYLLFSSAMNGCHAAIRPLTYGNRGPGEMVADLGVEQAMRCRSDNVVRDAEGGA